jgi:hypothetical protein
MHDCQRFREDWTAEPTEAVADCAECRAFCEEANTILQATAAPVQQAGELSDAYWNGFDARLRHKLVLENSSRISAARWRWTLAAAAAVLALAVSWGTLRNSQFVSEQPKQERVEFNDDHIQGLDPMVVTFLGQSEMFLRSFTKIEPLDVEDLADARAQARQQLMETARQRKMAANFAPVRITLDEYEGVLRDIKNLDSSEDLTDIQKRIKRNGLIANLKAYQPRMTLLSLR